MPTSTGLGIFSGIIPWGICGLLVVVLMGYISFEKKFPTFKQARLAFKQGKQLIMIHDPSGAVTGVVMQVVPGSNQLDLEKYGNKYGIKFKPRDMNQAEYLDNRLGIFHYIGDYPMNVTVKGVTALSRVRRSLSSFGVLPTPEKLNTIMYRDLNQDIKIIRKDMVPGSESRISDKEMTQLKDTQNYIKATMAKSTGSFIFADANDFLYSVGMSAASSLREWKSYITVVARGDMKNTTFLQMDAKQIGTIVVMIAIGLVIYKAGTLGSIASSIHV